MLPSSSARTLDAAHAGNTHFHPLNMVERFLSDITTQAIRRVASSVASLTSSFLRSRHRLWSTTVNLKAICLDRCVKHRPLSHYPNQSVYTCAPWCAVDLTSGLPPGPISRSLSRPEARSTLIVDSNRVLSGRWPAGLATVKGLGASIRRRIPAAGLLARRARHSRLRRLQDRSTPGDSSKTAMRCRKIDPSASPSRR
jgi:hypothetical protein